MSPSDPHHPAGSPDQSSSPPWPWALGVIITPSTTVGRRQNREQRLSVAIEAYKLGHFLADTLTVSAEHAAADLDDVRLAARQTGAQALILLDTCESDPMIRLALPEGITVHTVTAQSLQQAPS